MSEVRMGVGDGALTVDHYRLPWHASVPRRLATALGAPIVADTAIIALTPANKTVMVRDLVARIARLLLLKRPQITPLTCLLTDA